jgi:hypothetical protein
MFGMIVGIPQEKTNKWIGTDSASVSKAVWFLGDLTVSMLQVSDKIDKRIPDKYGNDPPEDEESDPFLHLSENPKNSHPNEQLNSSSLLQIINHATLLSVSPVGHAPTSSTVVHCNATSRVDNSTNATLESRPNIEELPDVHKSILRDIAKGRILELLSSVEARKLGVAINVVCKSMMLLVHDALMHSKFKADTPCDEEGTIIDPLGLESVPVKKFMLTCKGKALELEPVEAVERDECEESFCFEGVSIEGEYLGKIDTVGRQNHNAQVGEQTLKSFVVAFLHQLQEDTIVKKTIAFLTFGVLDVGPILTVIGHILETGGITLGIEVLGEIGIFCRIRGNKVLEFTNDIEGLLSVGSHFWRRGK